MSASVWESDQSHMIWGQENREAVVNTSRPPVLYSLIYK